MREGRRVVENGVEAQSANDSSRAGICTLRARNLRGLRNWARVRSFQPGAIVSILSLVCLLALGPGCSSQTTRQGTSEDWSKIGFDLSMLDADGLMGGATDKRALHYELCIPALARYVREVGQIDSTLVVSPAHGRIGCSADQYLCIGTTHQVNFRDVLLRLARLDFVERIEQSSFE